MDGCGMGAGKLGLSEPALPERTTVPYRFPPLVPTALSHRREGTPATRPAAATGHNAHGGSTSPLTAKLEDAFNRHRLSRSVIPPLQS